MMSSRSRRICRHVLLLALGVIASSGCCPKRPPIRTITINAGCLDSLGEPPPIPDDLGTDDNKTSPACDMRWEFCASEEAADKIVRYISGAQKFIRDARTHCATEAITEPGGE